MKITVPYICGQINDNNKSELLSRLSAFGADEVFISFVKDCGENSFNIEKLKEEAEFLNEHGYKVGVWLTTFSCPNIKNNTNNQVRIRINGELTNAACPFDVNFVKDYCELVTSLVHAGLKKIVLDDDLRMNTPNCEACCFCDEHMKFYSEYLGRPVTREQMSEHIFNGAPNEYRDAWMSGCREGVESFARAVRNAVDSVDGNVELMLCAGPSLFGADSTDAFKVVDILAGKTGKKEFRLIGAPYWAPHKLVSNNASAFDFARHQAFVAKQRGYITVGEGDPNPRPRFECSSSELEFFHTLMIADGNFDRMMKYGLDYHSTFSYETGYADMSEYNKNLYPQIEKMFSNKKCVGYNLVEPFDRIIYAHKVNVSPEMSVIHSGARKFLNDLSLPSTFEEGGANIIFGENARKFDNNILKYGNILDIASALILTEQGVDVGIEHFEKVPTPSGPINEKYLEYNDFVHMYQRPEFFYRLNLREGAVIRSEVTVGKEKFVASYTYENGKGERFLVFGYDLQEMMNAWGYVRNYYRQREVVEITRWLNKKPLHAVCVGNPDLYILTKTDGNSLAIGLWNHFADKILKPEITLGDSYNKVKFIGCDGILSKDRIILNKAIEAYGYCFIEVSKK